MKRWLWYLAALVLVAALGWMPFSGTDVGSLQPVEVIRVTQSRGRIIVETDTGDLGVGDTLESAFADLKASTAGEVFLDTADYLLLSPECTGLLPELGRILRPACNICLENGQADLTAAAAFLSAHEPGITLQDHLAGTEEIPTLTAWKGRMHLVS